jgi:hypothetical protein
MMTRQRILAASLGLLALCGCQSTQSSVSSEGWLSPSPALEQRLKDEAQRMPWTHGIERVELIQWFASVGEPAYPTLLALARDARRDVASAGWAALGATRDSRLVESLRKIPFQSSPENRDLGLERARAFLRLGDWSQVPVLIEGLGDERLMVRGLSIQALFEATHETFGYDAKAAAEPRQASMARWNEWWQSRSQDALLKRD